MGGILFSVYNREDACQSTIVLSTINEMKDERAVFASRGLSPASASVFVLVLTEVGALFFLFT